MTASDFYYDGLLLSDLGYMICQFDEGGGFNTSSAGSQLTLNQVSAFGGRKQMITGASYEECFQTDISICKPDGGTFNTDVEKNLIQ